MINIDKRMQCTASYSDGQSAIAHKARVYAEDDALIFELDNGTVHKWRYEDLTAGTPIVSGKAAQIGVKHQPGARLFINHIPLIDLLIHKAPHISHKRKNRNLALVMGLVSALVIGYFSLSAWFDYSLSYTIARQLPDDMRRKMGKYVVHTMLGDSKTCSNPAGLAALNKLSRRLTASLPGEDRYFQIKVADLRIINAFAAPGERIIISRQLIEFAKSPDEVAGVLAHEMGHGLERHPEAGLVRALGFTAVSSMMFGGSDLGASIGGTALVMLQMKYSRSAESQADRHAVTLMKAAGISARGLSDFFRRLDRKMNFRLKNAKTLSRALDLISSNPDSLKRAELIEKIPAWPATPALSPTEWNALRHICGRLSAPETPGEKPRKTPHRRPRNPQDVSLPAESRTTIMIFTDI